MVDPRFEIQRKYRNTWYVEELFEVRETGEKYLAKLKQEKPDVVRRLIKVG